MGEHFDISPLISEEIAVFPGDQPFSRQVSLSFAKGDHLELSSIVTTVHLGAHADGANHYSPKGQGIQARRLLDYMGLCQVVRMAASPGERIGLRHWGKREVLAPRVLFYTGSFPDPNQWREDFNSLSPELIEYLAGAQVCLVGIDTPSIDPASAKNLESHQAVARHGLSILEGLVLEAVPEGLYHLVALPLPLKDLDASPVRAILLPRDFDWNN